MLKNKQNKGTANKQEVIYTEPKFSRSPQKRKTPETNQSNVISGEQQVNYMELKFPRSSHHQHRERLFRKKRKDHQSRAWQVTAGSLGVLCVVLMATFGILLANKLITTMIFAVEFFHREDENGKISPIPTLSSPNGECSCDLCSTHWIGFGNSFYHLYNTPKSWADSHAACAELNAHLLKIDTDEELEILSMFQMRGWVGLKINKTDMSWLWEDGTKVVESLLKFLKMENHSCAYAEGNYVFSNNCSSEKSYICSMHCCLSH
ncbi:killer cell lectin-like receptor subfamily I member 1 isoform X1 [Camelus ferus]|uniref:Killer cell lectin-like receptor subfamily I member 1 isoform X1 n=2 Tax=Camelus TaxID=9836 RepID=A0A8B8SGW8_CAMFR|nr:killer cell lectin-like receptor subfamily I member 1 isoform X1 [Camelus ferus]XP_032329075.1 killer cell lectin-like receptor subfamily I member 1 isoform X1 [Camelus ferus]